MKSYVSNMPAAGLSVREKPSLPRAHAKVRRFLYNLNDEQVMDLIAVLEKTLATHGMDPGCLRTSMIAWTAQQP